MRIFYITGILETCSTFFLYFIAMPLKYLWGDEILVKLIGPAHGFLCILYISLLGLGWFQKKWNIRAVITGGLLSILPGGPIWLEYRIDQSEYQPK